MGRQCCPGFWTNGFPWRSSILKHLESGKRKSNDEGGQRNVRFGTSFNMVSLFYCDQIVLSGAKADFFSVDETVFPSRFRCGIHKMIVVVAETILMHPIVEKDFPAADSERCRRPHMPGQEPPDRSLRTFRYPAGSARHSLRGSHSRRNVDHQIDVVSSGDRLRPPWSIRRSSCQALLLRKSSH